MKDKIIAFWKKRKNLLFLIGVVVVLALFMNYFYFHIIKTYEDGPKRLVNTLVPNAAGNELENGEVIAQTFSKVNDFDGFHLKMTANGTKQDKVEIKLLEDNTDKVIQKWGYDFTQIAENKMYDFQLKDGIRNKRKTGYRIELNVIQKESASKFCLFSTGMNTYKDYEAGKMLINGKVQKQDVVFDVYQYEQDVYGFLKNIYIFLFVFCLALTAGVLYFGFYKKCKIEQIFIPVVIVWGIIYMIILPPFSSPDEPVHFGTAYKISNDILGKKALSENNVVLMRKDDATVPLDPIPTAKIYEYTIHSFFNGVKDTTPTEWKHGNLYSKNVITHLPAAIGISIARVLGLGSVPLIYMGRLMNLLFYVTLVYFAIKFVPFGKMVFFVLSMTPMLLELIGSYSYDAVINALAFLSIALLLQCIYGEEKIGIKRIAELVALASLLGPSKIVYSFIFVLCIFIPKEKFKDKRMYYGTIAAVFAAVILSNVYVNMGAMTQVSGAENGAVATRNVVQQYSLKWCLQNPFHALKIYLHTTRVFGLYYFQSMFGSLLGWLELPVSHLVIYVFAMLIGASFFFERDTKEKIFTSHRIVTIGILLAVYALVLFSMLSGCTPFGTDTILGVQGRYFLAVMPLFLIVLTNEKIKIKKIFQKYFLLFFHIGNIYVIFNMFATIVSR